MIAITNYMFNYTIYNRILSYPVKIRLFGTLKTILIKPYLNDIQPRI